MATEYIVENGELFKVVQTHERAELDQVKAVVTTKQESVDALQTQVDALNVQLEASRGELEEAKSDAENAQRVVDEAAAANASETANDDGSTPVDITVADTAPQF